MEYKITLKNSGHHFVCKHNESLLDAALRQGVALSSGCRRGICGVCIGRLDVGEVEYPDDEEPMAFFAEAYADDADENNADKRIVICEAVPRTDLILDMHEIDSEQGLEFKNLQVEVVKQTALTDHVSELELALPDDDFLQFLAGQIIHLQVNEGQKLVFAPANAPLDGRSLILHIDNRDKKNAQLQLTNANTLSYRIEGPSGNFFLRHNVKRPRVFIAEGVGFAAIQSMVEQCIARKITSDLVIYWIGDSEADLYRLSLVKKWEKNHPNIAFVPVVGSNAIATLLESLGDLPTSMKKPLAEFDIYINATASMVDEIEFELFSLRVDPMRVFYHRF